MKIMASILEHCVRSPFSFQSSAAGQSSLHSCTESRVSKLETKRKIEAYNYSNIYRNASVSVSRGSYFGHSDDKSSRGQGPLSSAPVRVNLVRQNQL